MEEEQKGTKEKLDEVEEEWKTVQRTDVICTCLVFAVPRSFSASLRGLVVQEQT